MDTPHPWPSFPRERELSSMFIGVYLWFDLKIGRDSSPPSGIRMTERKNIVCQRECFAIPI